ncbi:hypothetical protein [Microbispora bryophytorum]|uniref:hypothetical protein n=1 Tax=Microbispora bryophytorum TaxID=1460882 RepID=UPI0034010342
MPRHTDTHKPAGQKDQEHATRTTNNLVALLAARHNIPADVHDLPTGVVVSVFHGLLAHVGPVIWWNVPDLTGERDKPLTTYAHTAETAADRLAEHYRELRALPLGELVNRGLLTPLAAELLTETEVHRAAAPV